MKRSFVVLLVLGVFILGGCFRPPIRDLAVTVDKTEVHPPEAVTITATDLGPGWTYTFEMPSWSMQQGSPQLTVTLHREDVPGRIRVIAEDDTGQVKEGEVWITLRNQPVNMDFRPFVSSYGFSNINLPSSIQFESTFDLMALYRDTDKPIKHIGPDTREYLTPLEYEVFRCEFITSDPLYPGHVPATYGFYDPDGDSWRIVEVEAWYQYKPEKPDAVFASVRYQGPGIYKVGPWDNAFLIVPTWPLMIDADEKLPLAPPGGVPGYPSVCHDYNCSVGPYPEQDYFVKITTEDEFGARRTKTFKYRLLPTGCW